MLVCRSGLEFESLARKSLIPSPLKQTTQPPQHTGSSDAEPKDLTSMHSAASTHSIMAMDTIPSPVTVLGLERTPEQQSAACENEQLDPASADQVIP